MAGKAHGGKGGPVKTSGKRMSMGAFPLGFFGSERQGEEGRKGTKKRDGPSQK